MTTPNNGHILGRQMATPKTFTGLITIIALASLTACGGGEDASNQISSENTTIQAAKSMEDQKALDQSMSVAPSASDLLFDQSANDTFVASLPSTESYTGTSEKAMALNNLTGVPIGDARVKWNPGHYVSVNIPSDEQILTTLAEIKDLPHVKGIMVRYPWKMLEPTKGVYNFSAIDRDLAQVTAAGKRLFIMLNTKDFRNPSAVPDYLHTPEYENGSYKIKIAGWSGSSPRYGENVALYNNNVRDRLVAITKALGSRYNRHNNVEGMTFNETAFGQPVTPLTSTQQLNWFNNLAYVNKEANKAFPNTVVMQFINFPRTYVNGLVKNMLNNGVALGGPDTFFHDADLNNYVYPHYDTANGKVAIGPSVQPENYTTTSHLGTAPAPQVQDIYNFGKNRLHANYMFWTKYNPKPAYHYDNVIQMFKSSSFPKDSAGGLNRNCPSAYVSCVSKL